jgi:hypothetical protein
MSIILYIDGQVCDVRPNTEIALTKQVATVLNLEQRQTDFTNRFILPPTPRNISIMEQLRENGNTSTRPYKLADARLEVGGIPYGNRLQAIVRKSDRAGYEVNLIGDAFSFKASAEALPLSQAVDSFVNGGIHALNTASWKALQNASGGYTYPLIAQLRPFPAFPKTRLYIDLSYPAFFTRDLMNSLLANYYTSVSGSVFTKSELEQDLTFATATESDQWKAYELATAITEVDLSFSGTLPVGAEFVSWFPLTITKNDKAALTNVSVLTPILFRYSAPANRQVQVNLAYEITGTFGGGVKIQLRTKPTSQGNPLTTDTIIAETDLITSGIVANAEFTAIIESGRDLYFTVYCTNSFNFTIRQFDVSFQPLRQCAFSDLTMNPKLLLPNVNQWQYFSDQVKRFGLIWQEQNDGSVRIECFKDVFDAAFGIEDWSNKVIEADELTYSMAGSYGKRSFFQYAGERSAGILDESYNGWGFYDMDNDNYPTTAEIVKSIGLAVTQALQKFQFPFANSLRIGGFEVVQPENVVLLESVDALSYGRLRQNDDFAANYALFILQNGAFSGNTGQVQQPSEFIANVEIQEFQTLSFQYFGNLLPSIARPEVLEAQILLSEVDMYTLDFFKLKYFEQFQANYYLLKAENYIPGKPTKCTFLKVKS